MTSWKIFVLGHDKSPLPNCAECRVAGPEHDREACACLTCHGFYAAVNDPNLIAEMMARYPGNPFGVRTGAASGIIVLDAEGVGSPSGIDVLDGWESWVDGGWSLPDTGRIATTPSGGVHRYYEYVPGVRSRNRVLPGVDLKSDGGYVVLPLINQPERVWLKDDEPSVPLGPFRDWLLSARGRSVTGGVGVIGHSAAYDYDAYVRDGCPDGVRDEFFNELIFRLRKAGVPRDTATQTIREHWKRVAQPPDAKYFMAWHHVEYKIDRMWRTVDVDKLSPTEEAWLRSLTADEPMRVGRVTVVPRGGR